MADKKASKKKDVDVKEAVKKVEEEVKEAISYTEKTVARRGKAVTVRTYSDGKVEEL